MYSHNIVIMSCHPIQSLQNALDKIYDAKVPDVWLKVCLFNCLYFFIAMMCCIRYRGTPPLLDSGTLNFWREMHSFVIGYLKVDLEHSG